MENTDPFLRGILSACLLTFFFVTPRNAILRPFQTRRFCLTKSRKQKKKTKTGVISQFFAFIFCFSKIANFQTFSLSASEKQKAKARFLRLVLKAYNDLPQVATH